MMNFADKRMWSMLGQRGVFAMRMAELAAQHEKLVVLTADLCQLSGLDRFAKLFPRRLINAGIAEQNMVGMAAGLAKEGMLTFATTYASFLSMRSCEQIRHLCAYCENPVKLIASGAGCCMGMSGNSHYTYEDIAIMRAMPGMTVLSPADGAETYKMIDAVLDYPRPVYIRLTGTVNIPMVYKEDYCFELGKAVALNDATGSDITVFATGTLISEVQKAVNQLREVGLDVKLINMHTIKPLDEAAVALACKRAKMIVTAEEHSVIGGLGGAVAEAMSMQTGSPRLLRIGMPDAFFHPGEYAFVLDACGLTAAAMVSRIQNEFSHLAD